MQMFGVRQIFLLETLRCVWQVSANEANENENKNNIGTGTKNSNKSEHGDQFNEEDFVIVNSAGEVFPLHLNPALKPFNETLIGTIPQMRVVGGKYSIQGAVPYQISIQLPKQNICGGAIYNSRTIITAAHCFYLGGSLLPKHVLGIFSYVAGEFNIDLEEGNEQRQKSANIIIYPDYNASKSFHDIAIVSLAEPYIYNNYVQPLPIDLTGIEKVEAAMISGWGYTIQREVRSKKPKPIHYSKNLKEAIVRVFTKEESLKIYQEPPEMQKLVQAGLICAGKEIGTVDACQGDSGGPLACFNPKEGNRRFLCGVIATGMGCGLPGRPGLYTRVADYHDWIIQNAGNADKMTMDDSRDSVQLS